MTADQTPHTFQVDLRGLVDLLSHHLYSSPRVYCASCCRTRVDAITARRAERARRARAGAAVRRRRTAARRGHRHRPDRGRGAQLLATIGRSSKRDGLEASRGTSSSASSASGCSPASSSPTRSAWSPAPPGRPTRRPWSGAATRRRFVHRRGRCPSSARPEPGTTVHLTARPGCERVARPQERVGELARRLRLAAAVRRTRSATTAVTDAAGRRLGRGPTPVPTARRVALARALPRRSSASPRSTSIDLDVPVAGVRGVGVRAAARRQPGPARPATASTSRACCSPTAPTNCCPTGRSSSAASSTPTRCGPPPRARPLRRTRPSPPYGRRSAPGSGTGSTELAAGDRERLAQFLSVHHLGVKSLARHDDGDAAH